MTGEAPVLVADIGGTNARFGLVDGSGVRDTRILRGAEFPSFQAAAESYLDIACGQDGFARPRRAAVAVAGPVTGDRASLTNIVWGFSIEEVRHRLGLDRLLVVNDFTAVALSVPRLTAADRVQVGTGGEGPPGAPVGVIGPGSGLGVSGLIRGPGGWVALSGEGGHATMSATDARDEAVLGLLRTRFGHVSAERVLSGPGLVNLYEALRQLNGREAQPRTAAEITAQAHDGTDPDCVEAVELFCAMLGTVAGNLALTLGALGGVYIAGGIVPRLGALFHRSAFRAHFIDKGRMRPLLEPVPTFLITHELPAFLGLLEAVDTQ